MKKHVLCARHGSKRFVLFILPNNPLKEVRMVSPFFGGGSGRLYDSLKVTRPMSPGARRPPPAPPRPDQAVQQRLRGQGCQLLGQGSPARGRSVCRAGVEGLGGGGGGGGELGEGPGRG